MSKPKFTAILTFRLFIDGLTRYRWLAIPDRIYISHHLSGFSGILKLRNELLCKLPSISRVYALQLPPKRTNIGSFYSTTGSQRKLLRLIGFCSGSPPLPSSDPHHDKPLLPNSSRRCLYINLHFTSFLSSVELTPPVHYHTPFPTPKPLKNVLQTRSRRYYCFRSPRSRCPEWC